ncbi:hypothetical protein JCM5353_008035, partial [Sporobolomyces roseus]
STSTTTSSHKPNKRARTSPSASIDPSLFPEHLQPTIGLDNASINSSTIRERERNRLRVVAQGLAPQLVLDQPLSVPSAPPTLRHCLDSTAPLLPISVLRACLNEASTNALFSSATSLEASGEETTRLLNEVDSFQSTVLGLLDEVERRYRAEEKKEENKRGVKREVEEEQDLKPFASTSTAKKYMLHRGGANGADLFTSAAFLSDRELEQVSLLQDADLVSVHPSLSSSTSTSSSLPLAPSLGSLHPQTPPLPLSMPAAQLTSRAPGQLASIFPTLPALLPPQPGKLNQLFQRETKMLDYGSFSSFAPSFDSSGSTDGGYYRAAQRLTGRDKMKKWERSLVPSKPIGNLVVESREFKLSEEERETLKGMKVELEGFVEGVRGEEKVWETLRRNEELLERLQGAQIARVRKAGKKEEKRKRKGKINNGNLNGNANGGPEGEDEEGGQLEKRDVAEGIEKEDAEELLSSLTALLSSFTSTSSAPSLLPSSALIRSLTPLIVGELTRDASFSGGLEPIDSSGIGGWEKAVKESSSAGGGAGFRVKQE